SVNICRLRLWIELLKNAYYTNTTALETLPNIDINIKCGNSLVSRFGLETDLKYVLKKSGHTIEDYRAAVAAYRNADSKEQKRAMEHLIAKIKSDFGIHGDSGFKIEKAVLKLRKKEEERNEIESNKIFENAFEWRFEFPEVLDDD